MLLPRASDVRTVPPVWVVAPVWVVVGGSILGWRWSVGSYSDVVGNVDHLDIGVIDDITLLKRYSDDSGREGGSNDCGTHCGLLY